MRNQKFRYFINTVKKRTLSVKFLFVIIGISFCLSVVWIETARKINLFHNEALTSEALQNVAKDIRFVEVYRDPHKISKELKYILLWTPDTFSPFYFLGKGQQAFLNNNCSVVNCYVTSNTKFFDDITKFHAVAFNGRNMRSISKRKPPDKRAVHQKYIFFNMESADNYPICDDKLDDFFNWTATYKLNSDIPYPYIIVRNKTGHIIGPKKNIHWNRDDFDKNDYKLQNKSKAVAWFVSSCYSRSGRNTFVRKLQRALLSYDHEIDVYGSCGTLQCPIDKHLDCGNMLERDYYFYLSLENSFDEDYVTEKLLTALSHDVVPIVYGGADYSRFLPPGSYLDARKMSIKDLAAQIANLINSPSLYRRYFKWKKRYSFSDPSAVENVCAVCAALNNNTMLNTISTYKEFRKWWNPNYEERCQRMLIK